jgi:hypothetical protein
MDRGARPLVFFIDTAVFSYELSCIHCRWRTVSGRDDAITRLRAIGLLRRDREPDDELIGVLLVEAAPRMVCPSCGKQSVAAAPSELESDDEWQAAVLCEICRSPIPPERLEAIAETKRCAACQGKAEAGKLVEAEPEFCPACGSLVELRLSRGTGITRYKRFCTGQPPCRL